MAVTVDEGFDAALALTTVGDGRVDAEIAPGWDVRGNPHGGYLLALAAAAMGCAVPQPDPLTISATYLAPPRAEHAQLFVEVLRLGKRQSIAAVRLVQDGIERVRATATFGELSSEAPRLFSDDCRPPAIPAPLDCRPRSALRDAEGEPIALHERLSLRFDPRTSWLVGQPSGIPVVDGWLAFADGRPPDSLGLLLFSDGLPPSLFEKVGRTVGYLPTVQLTTYLFAKPAPGGCRHAFAPGYRVAALSKRTANFGTPPVGS